MYILKNIHYTTGATSGAGTAFLSWSPVFIPGFYCGSCYSCMFCSSLFVPLYFFFCLLSWLCCLFFFDLRILITPLVSSNSAYRHISPLFTLMSSLILIYYETTGKEIYKIQCVWVKKRFYDLDKGKQMYVNYICTCIYYLMLGLYCQVVRHTEPMH